MAAIQQQRQTQAAPKFPPDDGLHRELTRRVAAYFEGNHRSRGANRAMVVKTAVLLAWFGASYWVLVFVAGSPWLVVAACTSLAFAIAGIGFGIQHDANHGAYAKSPAVNRVLGWTMDLVGASSFLWRVKHNVAHHTFTNVDGADDDINVGPLARLAPSQRRYSVHRLQHFYLWLLYGLLLVKWHFTYDFTNLARGRVAKTRFARPRGGELVELIVGKLAFAGLTFVVPALLHPLWAVVACYLAVTFATSVVLASVFQLAHCVEESAGVAAPSEAGRMPQGWAAHQIASTMDFAPGNRLLTWYVGGLNFQVEHHLFPRVCHVHYPALAVIVRGVCAERGVRVSEQATLRGAIASHLRWLKRMGTPVTT